MNNKIPMYALLIGGLTIMVLFPEKAEEGFLTFCIAFAALSVIDEIRKKK
ncbi:MAG TPA: hypothetical protein VHE12_05960 [bacterium]|nr:hypothetical protein [bacterium]